MEQTAFRGAAKQIKTYRNKMLLPNVAHTRHKATHTRLSVTGGLSACPLHCANMKDGLLQSLPWNVYICFCLFFAVLITNVTNLFYSLSL